MPMTPYQVDSIFAKWEDHHIKVLKLEKGSSKLDLDQTLFTECQSFSSLQVKMEVRVGMFLFFVLGNVL